MPKGALASSHPQPEDYEPRRIREGREWVAPITFVYLHSKEWICTDWAEPVQERKVAAMTAASDVAERDIG